MLHYHGLDHLVLRTANIEKMLFFYTEILNCPLEREIKEYGLFQLRAGNSLIDIIDVNEKLGRLGGGPPSKKENNLDHFCLLLGKGNKEEVVQYFATKNIVLEDFVKRYGATGFAESVYLKDPDGNTVELKLNN